MTQINFIFSNGCVQTQMWDLGYMKKLNNGKEINHFKLADEIRNDLGAVSYKFIK